MRSSTNKLLSFAAVLIIIFAALIAILSVPGPLYNGLVGFDHAIEQGFNPLRTNIPIAWIMILATYMGNPEIIIALELCLLVFIMVIHRKRIAALFLGGIIIGELASLFFKTLLERSRPDVIFAVSRHGYSFPSGHALLGIVFYGCLGFFAAHLVQKKVWKWVIGCITALIIFLIGVSRIYLSVHWASDVIGGWALGGACLLSIIAIFNKIHKHKKGDYIKELTRGERIGLTVVAFMVGFFVVYYFVTELPVIRSIV